MFIKKLKRKVQTELLTIPTHHTLGLSRSFFLLFLIKTNQEITRHTTYNNALDDLNNTSDLRAQYVGKYD